MIAPVQEQQLIDLDAEHPLGIEEAPVVAVEAEVEAELQRIVPEGFSIRCPKTAGWVVRRIVASRRYAEHVKVWAEQERRRAEAEEQRLIFLFGGALRQWAEAEIAKLRGRRRSVALPGGTVGFRAVPSHILIRDEGVVLRWAKQACPSAVVVSERLLKTPINEHFQKTGEVPEGVEVAAARDEFFVR